MKIQVILLDISAKSHCTKAENLSSTIPKNVQESIQMSGGSSPLGFQIEDGILFYSWISFLVYLQST